MRPSSISVHNPLHLSNICNTAAALQARRIFGRLLRFHR